MLHKCDFRESVIYEDNAIKSYFYHEDYTIKIKMKMAFLISDYSHLFDLPLEGSK